MLSKLLGGGLVDSVGKIVDELHTSDEEKAQAKIKLKELDNALNKAQTDINLADAKSTATGLGGLLQRIWRPLIGFSCALAIFWEFVLSKFILFICGLFQYEVLNIPQLDMGTLMPLVMSLLGMGALRTFEKTKGVAK